MHEILVHVSAPSTASDDARYRAQVAAIRDYLQTTANDQQRHRPSERQVSASDPVPSQRAEGHLADGEDLRLSPQGGVASLVYYRDLSDTFKTPPNENGSADDPVHDPQPILAIASPETKTIGSALVVAPRDRTRQGHGYDHDHDSLESLVSVIPDSQPEPLSLSLSSVHEGSASALALQGAQNPSLSPSPPHLPSSKRRRMENGELWGPSTSGTFVSAHEEPISSLAGNQSSTDKNNPQKAKPISQTPKSIPTTTATPGPTTTTTQYASPSTSTSISKTLLKNLPLQIRPPPPPISTSPFSTHITPTLSMLTERLKPARTYKPTRQTRELDKLERGYWAVQIRIVHPPSQSSPSSSSEEEEEKEEGYDHDPRKSKPLNWSRNWSAAFFARFWAFLSDFIGRDARAGWGVWCILDRVGGETLSRLSSTPDPAPARSDSGPGAEAVSVLLKVYAWGEIALHVYLVLFLASERRVRGLGAQWVDSREEVVIQMP